MSAQVLIYFSWSRPGESGAPLTIIDDRFPAIFELRRLFYPKFEQLADPVRIDQGIGGFLDHIQKPNFLEFAEQADTQTGRTVRPAERVSDDGAIALLDEALLAGVDTAVVISVDSLRTSQVATPGEIGAVRRFLADPDHLIAICPHHDIGDTGETAAAERDARRAIEHYHHGDKGIPPRQAFGGFARSWPASVCRF